MQVSMFRYFLAVAETGSIRQAATDLHVSASAISRQIQNLEHSFKLPLFERRPSGMYLTEEGRILELHMRRTMREMELARAKIDDIHGLVAGTIRYATIEGVARAWLFPAIADFQRDYPGVGFKGGIAGTEAVYAAVESDHVDFGIAIQNELHPEIEVVQRFATQFRAAMAPDHPLAGHDTLSLTDLVPYSLTMLGSPFQTRQAFNSAAMRLGLSFDIGFELDHIELIKSHVLETGGLTILPDYAVSQEAESGGIVIADISENELPQCTTVLCTRKGRHLTRAAESFIDRLRMRPM